MTNERCATGVDMTARIPENVSADWIIVTIMANAMPPRDPNDEEEDDDDEDEEEENENENENEDEDSKSDDDVEPAVVREPDE
jgi:ribosomal protein L12E/L44/L45/RPP1/RPP2